MQEEHLGCTICLATDDVPARCFGHCFLGHFFKNEDSVFGQKRTKRFVSQKLLRESLPRFGFFVGRIGKYNIKGGLPAPAKKFKHFSLPRLPFEFGFDEI